MVLISRKQKREKIQEKETAESAAPVDSKGDTVQAAGEPEVQKEVAKNLREKTANSGDKASGTQPVNEGEEK